ncbi:MAG: hypothetical protein WAP51_00355 [Candidatus Sungiibacteriota bacterium]
MTEFIDALFELVTEASRVVDPNPTGGGSDGDHFRWHVYRGDLGENIIADVAVLVRPSVSCERCTIEVFACVSTVDRSLGAISDSSWAAVATKETFAEECEALKAGLAEAIRKAWESLPELVRRLPEVHERRDAMIEALKNLGLWGG